MFRRYLGRFIAGRRVKYGAGQVVYPNWTFTRIGHFEYFFFSPEKVVYPKKYIKIFIYLVNPSEPTPNLNIYLFYFAFYPNFAIRPLPFWEERKIRDVDIKIRSQSNGKRGNFTFRAFIGGFSTVPEMQLQKAD